MQRAMGSQEHHPFFQMIWPPPNPGDCNQSSPFAGQLYHIWASYFVESATGQPACNAPKYIVWVETWPLLLLLAMISVMMMFVFCPIINPPLAMLLVIIHALSGLALSNSVVLNLAACVS